MTSFWAAVAMLTRVPTLSALRDGMGPSWFGIVGALVGVTGFAPLVVLGTAVPAAAAILAVGAMAVLSGLLHLDGLADTADALVAVGPGAAERARKDHAIGVGGATALTLILALEVASLATLASTSGAFIAGLACVAGGAASRAVAVVVGRFARSRATGGGLGSAFARQVRAADAAIATLTALAAAGLASMVAGGFTIATACLVGIVAGVAIGLALVRLRGQLDGDGLGATVELGFAAVVLSAAAIGRWPAA